MSITRPRIAQPPPNTPDAEEKTQGARLVATTLLDVIENSITSHPRSLQKRIGPSEIGIECDRRILHKLAGDPEPERGPAWKPTVGTACHSMMEDLFGGDTTEFLVEQRVNVGRIGGTDITGSTDLFLPREGVVLDWKFVGPSRLKTYRSKGPSTQYRAQAHLYGKGWAAAGHDVQTVMIAFLPRDGELADSYFWWEPYQPMVAIQALLRANQLHALLTEKGLEAALAEKTPCTDRWCPWCAPANQVRTKTQQGSMFATTNHQ